MAEGFFQQISQFLFVALLMNTALNLVTLKMLNLILREGRAGITFKDQHKMAILLFMLQMMLILSAFIGMWPLVWANELVFKPLLGYAVVPEGMDAFSTPF